ncbi:hypothetical protein SOVF_004340 [Spinacia oleracea]|nr:hypothetical protein SOVF_004340 [Spinacia oleracea]
MLKKSKIKSFPCLFVGSAALRPLLPPLLPPPFAPSFLAAPLNPNNFTGDASGQLHRSPLLSSLQRRCAVTNAPTPHLHLAPYLVLGRQSERIHNLAFHATALELVTDFKKSLNTVNSACDEVRNSGNLKEIMQLILNLGNLLNSGTARGDYVQHKNFTSEFTPYHSSAKGTHHIRHLWGYGL